MEDIYTEFRALYVHSKQKYKQTLFTTTATEFVVNPLYQNPKANDQFVLDTNIPQTTKSKKRTSTWYLE